MAGLVKGGRRPGSSPLVRGKDAAQSVYGCEQGIIPAHAGKSHAGDGGAQRRRDHPRSCGEKATQLQRLAMQIGSSPLMRGKAFISSFLFIDVGIIPAHAGKSLVSSLRYIIIQDHPRSCGEKQRSVDAPQTLVGSSPLMRGKVSAPSAARCLGGIIPAHAGKGCFRHSRT